MTDKPIIFSGPMVRAILDWRKTMTRRVVKPQPVDAPKNLQIRMHGCGLWMPWIPDGNYSGWCGTPYWRCPYGVPGDRLWLRETWADTSKECPRCPVSYRATWPPEDEECRDFKWRSPWFMPRWASRITLEVTGVRVERVQEISPWEALKEGVNTMTDPHPTTHCDGTFPELCCFRALWNSINAKRGFGWDTNCWVWVVSFRRVQP